MGIKISLIQGVEGQALLIGDIRVAGPKAWGGGRILKDFTVSVKDIIYALNNIYYPPHQPKGSIEKELESLNRKILNCV